MANNQFMEILDGIIATKEQTCYPWTDCKNTQPIEDGGYLICYLERVGKKYIVDIATWFNNNWYKEIAGRTHRFTDIITHWMPLPEQPEELQDDG